MFIVLESTCSATPKHILQHDLEFIWENGKQDTHYRVLSHSKSLSLCNVLPHQEHQLSSSSLTNPMDMNINSLEVMVPTWVMDDKQELARITKKKVHLNTMSWLNWFVSVTFQILLKCDLKKVKKTKRQSLGCQAEVYYSTIEPPRCSGFGGTVHLRRQSEV